MADCRQDSLDPGNSEKKKYDCLRDQRAASGPGWPDVEGGFTGNEGQMRSVRIAEAL
jgi:hypothetical protein